MRANQEAFGAVQPQMLDGEECEKALRVERVLKQAPRRFASNLNSCKNNELLCGC